MKAQVVRLTAALAEAEGERDRATASARLFATGWHEAEADAATGRAVARRYRDGWGALLSEDDQPMWERYSYGHDEVEPATPAEVTYLASLSDEPT